MLRRTGSFLISIARCENFVKTAHANYVGCIV